MFRSLRTLCVKLRPSSDGDRGTVSIATQTQDKNHTDTNCCLWLCISMVVGIDSILVVLESNGTTKLRVVCRAASYKEKWKQVTKSSHTTHIQHIYTTHTVAHTCWHTRMVFVYARDCAAVPGILSLSPNPSVTTIVATCTQPSPPSVVSATVTTTGNRTYHWHHWWRHRYRHRPICSQWTMNYVRKCSMSAWIFVTLSLDTPCVGGGGVFWSQLWYNLCVNRWWWYWWWWGRLGGKSN